MIRHGKAGGQLQGTTIQTRDQHTFPLTGTGKIFGFLGPRHSPWPEAAQEVPQGTGELMDVAVCR